jgi:uncharacterized protein YbaP (TraB family)
VCPLLGHAAQGSTPLIYEVRSQTNTVYLFGTIHVGTRGMYPLGANVEEAFARSKILALEADPTDQSAITSAIVQAMYRPPETISNHIPPDLLEQLKAVLPQVGLPFEYARGMKPYLLAMTLTVMEIQRLGYDPNMGIDTHLVQLAKGEGKQIVELESMQAQMQLFEVMSDKLQTAMLRATVEDIAKGELAIEMDDLQKAWTAGDADAIQENVLRETLGMPDDLGRDLYERIYDQRNRQMADKIALILEGSDSCFVAVGAGHLTGPSGLAELLKGKGFTVRRL